MESDIDYGASDLSPRGPVVFGTNCPICRALQVVRFRALRRPQHVKRAKGSFYA